MPFLKLLLLFTIIFSPSAHAGDSVNNGAGGMEQILLYTWTNLSTFMAPCLADQHCFRTPEGERLMRVIQAVHAEELRHSKLVFVEERNSDQVIRTEPHVGAAIIINLFPLYKEGLSLSLIDSLPLILRALEQHHPESPAPAFAESLAGLKMLWDSRVENGDLRKIGHSEISVLSVNQVPPSLLFGNGKGYQNITERVQAQLGCFGKSHVQHSLLNNFSWLNPERRSLDGVTLTLFGQISYTCKPLRGVAQDYNAQFQIKFSAKVLKGTAANFLDNPGKFDLDIAVDRLQVDLFDVH